MMTKHFWWIWAGGWSLTMPLVLLIAWWLEAGFAAHKARSLKAEAVVVGHHQTTTKSNGERSTTAWDDYHYTTQAGQNVSFSVVNSGSQPSRPVGHRAPILYQPSDPAVVRLNDGSHERGIRWVRLASPVGVIVGLIPLVFRRRSLDRQPTVGIGTK